MSPWLLLAALAAPAWQDGPTADAVEQVAAGVAAYEAGRFDEAAEAFSAAASAGTGDPRVEYDLGCALLAAGKLEEAQRLLLVAAAARDPELAADARFNLGHLAATAARGKLGEDPAAVPASEREDIVADLESAARRFVSVLDIRPEHEDARYNLEVLRLYIKQLQDLWKQQDESQEQDQEEDAVKMLVRMMKSQEDLRDGSDLYEEQPAGPERAEELREAVGVQEELRGELVVLKERLAAQLEPQQPPGGSGGPGAAPPAPVPQAAPPGAPQPTEEDRERMQQVLELVQGLADRSGESMERAAAALREEAPERAVGAQGSSVDDLERIFQGLAPFETLLRQAIEQEEELLGISEDRAEEGPAGAAPGPRVPEVERLAQRQGYVSGWADLLAPHAEQRLSQVRQQAAALEGMAPGDPNSGGMTAEQIEKMRADMEAYVAAFEKALENGPRCAELSRTAESELGEEDFPGAAPIQQEVLELLQEIANLLPQDQDQGQNQDQESQEPEDQEEQEDEQQEQPQPEDRSEQDEEGPPPEPQDLSREQAERLLQQAKEREQEYKRKLEELMQRLPPVPVPRDW